MPGTSFDRCAYAVFKGGGVAGMAHVGALKELEKSFKFIGYAGTSAGSLVALLAAAGLTPDEMREALKKLELKSLIGPFRYLIWMAPIILALGWFCFVAWPVTWFIARQHSPAWWSWILTIAGLVAAVFVGYISLSLGLVPTERLRKFLIREVKTKIKGFDRETTFKQFRAFGAKPLKVFATDLSGKALQPFDENTDDGHVQVVDAVIASAAFPLFFWPGKILGRCMTDGGIASNLPVFSFDQELGERRIPVIAFDLVWKEHPKKGRLWIIEFLIRLIVTAVQSHEAIIENLTTRVFRLRIKIPEGIDVMDFSLEDTEREKLFDAGADAAKVFLGLDSVLQFDPIKGAQTERQYVQAQYAPERLVVPLLRTFCREAQEQLGVAKPRACIFMAISDSVRRIVYDTFDEDDPDKDFELTLGEGITGYAWEKKQFAFGVLPWQNLTDSEKVGSVKSDRNSAVCVPLFRVDVPALNDARERPPFGVLVLDSSSTIDHLNWAKDATSIRSLGQRWAAIFAKLLE